MPSTATATDSRTPTALPMLAFPSVHPLVLTPSPRELFPLPTLPTWATTTARGPLTPTTLLAMPSLVFPSDPPPVWTPSPRALMPPPRDTLLTPTATSDTPMATLDTTTVKF